MSNYAYLRRRAQLYGKPIAKGVAGGAALGAITGLGMSQDPSSRFHKRPGRAALVGALTGGSVGGTLGATHGVAMRQAEKIRAYAHRQRQWGKPGGFGGKRTKFTGGTRGYHRKERWDPFTGHGFGKKGPSATGPASGAAHGIWNAVPDDVRKKMQGVASRARRGSTEAEKSTAKSILEKMMRQHGVKGNVDDFVKHAAFRAGFVAGIC